MVVQAVMEPEVVTQTVTLKLVVDEEKCRGLYDDYVGDVEWYRDNDQLAPDHPDEGYRTGVPQPWEEYRAGLIECFLDEIMPSSSQEAFYSVEVVGSP
jgi:hypothetical protein